MNRYICNFKMFLQAWVCLRILWGLLAEHKYQEKLFDANQGVSLVPVSLSFACLFVVLFVFVCFHWKNFTKTVMLCTWLKHDDLIYIWLPSKPSATKRFQINFIVFFHSWLHNCRRRICRLCTSQSAFRKSRFKGASPRSWTKRQFMENPDASGNAIQPRERQP